MLSVGGLVDYCEFTTYGCLRIRQCSHCRVGSICDMTDSRLILTAYMCLTHPPLRPICIPHANVADSAL